MSSVEFVEETGSTNADLIARIAAGEQLPEGFWLRAGRQTGGRGRLGRKWESPSGNLFCSTIVQIRPDDPSPSTMSMVTGLAVFDTVERCLFSDTPMLLKWPNDLLVYDAKIAGILLERQGNTIVVGIGINVCEAPELPDRTTISIGEANGKFANGPDRVLDMLSEHFAKRLIEWRDRPLPHTLLEWSARSHRYNDKLRVSGPDGNVLHASYRGIDSDGGLRILPIGASETTIHAGDVTLHWHDDKREL